MSEWIVYSKDGLNERCSVKRLEYNGTWMGACSLSLDIDSPTPVVFEIGDYIEYRGERFEINYDPTVIKNSSNGSVGNSFSYKDVVFNSLSDELTRCDFLDYVPSDNLLHYSSLPNFTFFADSIEKLAERIQVNLDRVYKDEKKWTIEVHPEYVSKKDVNIVVNSITCWDALALVKSEFDANFIIRGRKVIIGTEGIAVDKLFSYGKGNGLVSIEKNAEADQKIITRLRAYGSTKNMPPRYYYREGSSVVPNNLSVQNLMMPGFPDSTSDPYIDSPNIGELGVREGTVFFDGSGDLPEIYPSMEGMTAEELKGAGISVNASGRLDEILSADQIQDNGVFEEGATIETFQIKIKDVGFDINDHLSSSNATISMKNGMCGGRDFEIVSCEKTDDGYLLTCNRHYDQSLDLYFPYNNYQIKQGDQFVLLNIEMPDVYIQVASQQLYDAARAYLYKNDYVRYSYTPTVDNVFLARQHDEAVKNGIESIYQVIKEGDLFLFEDSDLGIEGSVIIDTLTITEDKESSLIPQYKITLRNDKTVGTIQKIQNQIDSIVSGKIGVSSDGGYNAAQIKSLIKTFGSTFFLRKDQDDRTEHNLGVGGNLDVDGDASTGGNQTIGKNLEVGGTATIGSDTTIGGQTTMQKKATAKKGLQIGESFIPGILTGSGGFFDEYANGEIESLIIRRFLEVPELRFNRVEIKLGDKWNAPGAGIFESVVPDTDNSMTGTGYLKLEEGEYGAIAVGDICMGIFHSEVASENATADSDDSRGNFQFAGFYTCYFTITEITDYTDEEGKVWHNKQFRYQLRPVSDRWKLTYHPSAQMTFVSYGSFSRTDRQTSVYTTRTYTRLLKNQNTWEISAANIAMQYGNMENMSIHGLDMTGYSMYLNNIYMTGIVRQVRPDGTPVMVVNDRGEWVSGTTYAYYDRVNYEGSLWLCVNESGTNTVPSKGDASWLLQVEAGVGIKSAGQWQTANTPYKANTIVTFADSVWISNKETSEAPFPIYTDNQGNRLTFNDGGYILVSPLIQSADWDLLLSAPDLTKGEDGKSIEVRYSADKTNWHFPYVVGDVWMQQRLGDTGIWSEPMPFIGEAGAPGSDGIYPEFQFAKNTSSTTAPITGWQDGPPSIGKGEFLWMRQRVFDPNTNTATSWQTVRIKGDTGDDGEGFTNMGPWRTGMTVPKMGVVTMGGSVYVAKVATTNPPLWCYTDNAGNRLLFNDGGYILTGEFNTAEYDLWVEKPKDGKDGKDGINGTNGKDGKDGKDGEDGKQGIQGCIVRDSEWAVGVDYHNDEALTSGTRWLDVALVRDNSAATGWRAYKCKESHTSTTSNAPGNDNFWEEFSANFTAIFTSLIIAKNAKITFLQGNQLLIQEDNGTITAGLSGSNDGGKYRFWAGASTPDNAPFRVDKYGNAWMTKAHVTGEVNATSGKFEGEITAGSLAFKAIVANGSSVSMNGYTFAKGHGIYTLPSPKGFTQVYAFCDWYIRTARDFTMKAPSPNKIVIRNAQYVSGFEYVDEYMMSDRTLYKFTCMPNDTYEYVWVVTKEDMI